MNQNAYVMLCAMAMMAMPLQGQQVVAAETSTTSPAGVQTMSKPVTVDLQGMSLRDALSVIAESAAVRMHYRVEAVTGVNHRIELRAVQQPLGSVLEQVLSGTQLRAVSSMPNIVTVKSTMVYTPMPPGDGIVVGHIIHATTRRPISGVAVKLNDSISSVTDESGTFRVAAQPGRYTLSARKIGMEHIRKIVVVRDGETLSLELVMDPGASVLNEVVVTGTVTATERRAITTPITVITADDIERRGITRIEQLFRGEVPGVVALEKGSFNYLASGGVGDLGRMESAEVYVRGSSNLGGNSYQNLAAVTNPLKTYVDGVEMVDPSLIATIDPASIERIEILTGPQAATVYGSGAMGGVMQIFTKRGTIGAKPDLSLALKFGWLENSLSDGLTPTHNHTFRVSEGMSAFSYAASLSYTYTGQWRPEVYTRRIGASVGATLTRGSFTAQSSAAFTVTRNGSVPSGSSPLMAEKYAAGEWIYTLYPPQILGAQRTGSTNQNLSLQLTHATNTWISQQVTFGRAQNTFRSDPESPLFGGVYDSLYKVASSSGARTTAGYNLTLSPTWSNLYSSILVVGINGSWGNRTQIAGCLQAKMASSLVGCGSGAVTGTMPIQAQSWGGFSSVRLGFLNRIYATLGLRGERNTNYGESHQVDWTPTQGMAYVADIGDVTVKFLASYGRATRPPPPEARRDSIVSASWYTIANWVYRLGNPYIAPEFSSGPQGGVEIYYGNRGAFTLNHYQQHVRDLIQGLYIDSFSTTSVRTGSDVYVKQMQYQNVASIRSHGWEASGSLQIAALGLRGTYSWNDSRVESVNASAIGAGGYYPGMTFLDLPTHTGNITATYSRDRLSATIVANYIGMALKGALYELHGQEIAKARLRQYAVSARTPNANVARPGYTHIDLHCLHRVSSRFSVTLDVTNLGNSSTADNPIIWPTIGRRTSLGVTIR